MISQVGLVFVCNNEHIYFVVEHSANCNELRAENNVIELRGCDCGGTCRAIIKVADNSAMLATPPDFTQLEEMGIRLLDSTFKGRPMVDLHTVPEQFLCTHPKKETVPCLQAVAATG